MHILAIIFKGVGVVQALAGSHLQFCFHRSVWCPCNWGQAVQGSPRCGWRNLVSVPLMVLSPCRLKDSEGETVNWQSARSPSFACIRFYSPFQVQPDSAGVKQDRRLEQGAYRKALGQPAG